MRESASESGMGGCRCSRKRAWRWKLMEALRASVYAHVRSVQDHPVKVEGPVAVGAALYAKCAGCHGADGGGGAGRQLSNNEVMKTFPVIEDMLRWIAYGTEKYKAAGVEIYGNPNRDGGVQIGRAHV